MRLNQMPPPSKTFVMAWITVSVHFDAFRLSPVRYLEACWWNLRRKRLRSQGQFAQLLGQSPRAYELWALRNDIAEPTVTNDASPAILALVDIRAGEDGLAKTLSSLAAEGVPTLLIGTQDMPTLADAIGHIDWSETLWLMPAVVGDTIAPGAIRTYRTATATTAARIAYADDDLLNKAALRTAPHFKPDWNGELFRHFDYLTGACILRATREDLEAVAGSDDWSSRLSERLASHVNPLHVRKVLHHRRSRPQPQMLTGLVLPNGELPLVTIIIPTRNRVDLLQTCLKGVADTDYPNIEILVVDNDSDDPATLAFLAGLNPKGSRVLTHGGAFNYSAINNRAAKEARGELLCLLNNDIEMIEPGWLGAMVMQALRKDVGAVGARLLYPDGRIQHAGVVIGMGNAAGHAHRLLDPEEEGYFRRHALPQFTSAVTAACLVVKRERFLAVGGLNEDDFAVAFNDVDLCMRLNQRGWQSFYEPRATLIHHESVSRGLDLDPIGTVRFAGELAALKRYWGTDEVVDPFHHPNLSRASEHFTVKL
jgi:GT2 family glycosyltransferase